MLFDYQKQTIRLAFAALREHQKVLCVLDTGGGKTFIFSAIAKQGQDAGRRVLILTDRILLNEQTVKSLQTWGCSVGVVNDGQTDNPVLIATVQTAARRLESLPAPDLVVIDEAHEGIFKKCLSWWPNAKYLGFTGTPVSGSIKDPLKNYWDKAVCAVSRKQLLDMGRLVPAKFKATVLDLSNLVTKAGEFTETSQTKVFGTQECFDAFKAELTKNEPAKTVIFCPSVELTIKTAENIKKWGYNDVWHILGETTNEERQAALKGLKNSENGILVNCMVATKGFDEPTLKRAVFFYATKSVTKFYQTAGRVCRSSPGKTHCEVWDYGGNIGRFWDVNAAVDWVGMFENPKQGKDGSAPMRKCESCESIFLAGKKVCPFCGHEHKPKEKKKASSKDLELKEVIANDPLFAKIKTATHKQAIDIFAKIAKDGGGKAAVQAAKKAAIISPKKKGYWYFVAAKAIKHALGQSEVNKAFAFFPDGFKDILIKSTLNA